MKQIQFLICLLYSSVGVIAQDLELDTMALIAETPFGCFDQKLNKQIPLNLKLTYQVS